MMKKQNLFLALLFLLVVPASNAQTWDEIIELAASNGALNDNYGCSVSISDDYAIVGACFADFISEEGGTFSDAGSAYILERNEAGEWEEVQIINASDANSGDNFGWSVAIHGDYAVIGAYGDDDSGGLSGSAYLFERDAEGVWTEIQKLTGSDSSSDDRFGQAVTISGDALLIGAPYHNVAGPWSGAAYLFERGDDGTWTETQKLSQSDAAWGDYFGASVSMDNDYAIVGAYGNTDAGTWTGAAYVFEKNDEGDWVETEKLLASDAGGNYRFGYSVSLSGDYAAVGVWRGYSAVTGAAYVFERDADGNWVETQKLASSDPEGEDRFGITVAVDGDYIIAGAPWHDHSGSKSGSAFLFERNDEGEWIEIHQLTAADGAYNDQLGWAVSIDDNHAIVGAIKGEEDFDNAGSVYVFQGCADLSLDATATELCEGEELVLNATSSTGGTILWSDGVENDVAFIPPSGITTYTASAGEEDCELQVEVTVFESPEVSISATDSVVCEGEEITLTGGGAASYEWEDDVENGVPFTPESGETTFTVTGTNDEGCENTATIDITVHSLPAVIATADDTEICEGNSLTLSGEGAVSYVWDEAVEDGIAFVPPLGETTFTVVGTDDNDCENTATIEITVHALPTVSAMVDNSLICEGESITLTGEGAVSYEWSGGVMDGVAVEPPAGLITYVVVGTDDNDCQNSDSIEVTVLEGPEVSITALTDDLLCEGEAGIILTGTPAEGTFSGSGISDDVFDPNMAGTGEHIVYYYFENDEGCGQTDSVVISVVNCLGLNGAEEMQVQVFPNPFNQFTTIDFGTELTVIHTILVYDLLGQLVYRNAQVTGNLIQLRKEDLGTGVFVLMVYDQNQVEQFTTRLITE